MNFEEERRAPTPNNPYMFNGSRTAPGAFKANNRRSRGGSRGGSRRRNRKNRSRK
jgi:hypothetical protein